MKRATLYAGLVAIALALNFVPELDLATSGLFYRPEGGFALADWPPVELLYRSIPWVTWAVLAIAAAAATWLFLMGRPLWRLDRKALVFLLASLALGPGLLANIVLKDHWGRARPTQIEAFGGSRHFTPAPLPAAECASNCAFVSGHAALGFSLVAFAFLLPPGRKRRGAGAAALGFGAIAGLGRIAQGGHFLSDVVYAGLLVYATTAVLHWWIVEHNGLAARPLVRLCGFLGRGAAVILGLGVRAGAAPAMRFVLGTTAAIILMAISISLVDRPLALFFHARDPDLRVLFDLTGRLGLTYGYLIAFGLAFVALHWGGMLPRLRPFARQLRALSTIPAFLFASIAASGIVVDVLKLMFGRPRPKLLFGSGVHDFAWLSLRPDHWSFPSGHSATIIALMTALWCLWPRHLLFYILVAAIVSLSRVVVGAHYLSDVFAGALIAVLSTCGVALIFAKGGVDLAAARRAIVSSRDVPPWPCRRFGRRATSGGRTELRGAGRVACRDDEGCSIGSKPARGSEIDSPPWPCASRPSTISAAGTPSTKR
jgi:lipid A 4'-phosphatase